MPFTRTFEGFTPPKRYDAEPFTSVLIREASSEAGSYTTIDTIALSPVDSDPSAPTSRNFTTALATQADGWYVIRWQDGDGATFDSDPIRYTTSGSATFATVEDVATRQGKTFTTAEEDAVDMLLALATASIADAALKDDDWAAALDPVPTILKGLCIELVGRAMANSEGLTSLSEQMGSYQYQKSFGRDNSAAFTLNALERRIVRRTVGSLNYSVRTPTATEDYLESLVS